MKTPERVTATNQVVNAIKYAIQSGKLKIGDKLPREADMAEELGVGRSSLREGIKILNTYGVVESRHGEGTFIVDNSAKNFFEFMGFFPSKENTIYYLELRRVVEVGNIIHICESITDEEIAKLESLADILGQEATIEDYAEADRAFHHTLISYTQNPMLIQINNMIANMRSILLYRIFCYPEIVQDAYTAHHGIISALKNRDLNKCIDAVSSHIDKTQEHADKLGF